MGHVTADLVVIGSGPAGQKAAMQAAKLGKKVIVIEKDRNIGGASLNYGTIPSKSLREAIIDLTDFYKRNFYGRQETKKEISINDLNYRLYKVLEEQRQILSRQFDKNNIQIIHGQAAFKNPKVVAIEDENGEALFEIEAEFFIIASGCSPRNPIDIELDHHRILDSTRLLTIDYLPRSMIVLGGGVIGSEYASFFSALGTKVTVVDKKTQMLSQLDQEISLHLHKL